MGLTVLLSLTLSAGVGVPPELGQVRWERDYAQALKKAKEKRLPVLVLFTEVPGCSTVNGYARDVLSDAVVVDASELFVRVAVFNNLGGDDAAVLKKWREPAWNNPVVRFIDADERELSPRLSHEGGRRALLDGMAKALKAAGKSVPEWLHASADGDGPVQATYAMGCFWEGEATLGALPQVQTTRTGFENGREVVQLTAASAADLRAIDAVAKARGYSVMPGAAFRASTSDDKYQLHGTAYAKLRLTQAQATKVNAAVGQGRDPSQWLAPSQR